MNQEKRYLALKNTVMTMSHTPKRFESNKTNWCTQLEQWKNNTQHSNVNDTWISNTLTAVLPRTCQDWTWKLFATICLLRQSLIRVKNSTLVHTPIFSGFKFHIVFYFMKQGNDILRVFFSFLQKFGCSN